MTMCGLAVMAYLWYAMVAVGLLCVVSAVAWHCSFSAAVCLICKVGMPVVCLVCFVCCKLILLHV